MRNDTARMVATLGIWAALAAILLTLAIVSPETLNLFSLVVMLGAGAIATSEVWGSGSGLMRSRRAREESAISADDKPKRMPAADTRWTETLSDDELNALESALAARRAQMDEDQQIELNRQLAEHRRDSRNA